MGCFKTLFQRGSTFNSVSTIADRRIWNAF